MSPSVLMKVCVTRSKVLPETSDPDPVVLEALGGRLSEAIRYGGAAGELRRDDEARRLWADVYPQLSEGRGGRSSRSSPRSPRSLRPPPLRWVTWRTL